MDLAAVEAVLGLVSETDLLETIERLQVRAAPAEQRLSNA